ncbi:MAG: hypothetical protein CVU90_02790 [Firmicutes bacterium HGW-Firmicutes-15]|nr:MAG: hypothetical protein CVU90_02790 [Firmicutes bacterium HGW-Firmicutes-15]
MRKKSKFLVFVLSPIPGLSHLYLGWSQRALTFFIIFLGLCAGGIILGNMGFVMGEMVAAITFFALALIWFMALSEALSLVGQEGPSGADENEFTEDSIGKQGIFSFSSRKMIAIAFSVIPGAGHMYLGLLKQGAQLMASFFLIMLVSNWLQLDLLAFIVPVIWFYSMFDVYHLLEEDDLRLDGSIIFDWFSNHPGWVGWGLIILGILTIMQRIVSPLLVTLLTPVLRNYIETSFVALILIFGGIKLLLGSKSKEKGEEL